jgi:hypothetical protein
MSPSRRMHFRKEGITTEIESTSLPEIQWIGNNVQVVECY